MKASPYLFTFGARWPDGSRLARVTLKEGEDVRRRGNILPKRPLCAAADSRPAPIRNTTLAVSVLIRPVLYQHGSLRGRASILSHRIEFLAPLFTSLSVWSRVLTSRRALFFAHERTRKRRRVKLALHKLSSLTLAFVRSAGLPRRFT